MMTSSPSLTNKIKSKFLRVAYTQRQERQTTGRRSVSKSGGFAALCPPFIVLFFVCVMLVRLVRGRCMRSIRSNQCMLYYIHYTALYGTLYICTYVYKDIHPLTTTAYWGMLDSEQNDSPVYWKQTSSFVLSIPFLLLPLELFFFCSGFCPSPLYSLSFSSLSIESIAIMKRLIFNSPQKSGTRLIFIISFPSISLSPPLCRTKRNLSSPHLNFPQFQEPVL